MPDDLMALAAKVEAASGGSSWLDAEIAEAIDPANAHHWQVYRDWLIEDDSDPSDPVPCPPPAYTASLDSAMMLVPEGYTFEIRNAYSAVRHPSFPRFDGEGRSIATPALALTAAALRARASQSGVASS